MIKKVMAVLALAGISGCGEPMNFSEPPSSWTDATRAQFAQQSQPIKCSILFKALRLTATDEAFIQSEIEKMGLNRRDLEILNDPKNVYGTGMSFPGLQCAAGEKLYANTAFYPGVGHQWQVPFGSGYVYLEGDGTDQGMRVKSWN